MIAIKKESIFLISLLLLLSGCSHHTTSSTQVTTPTPTETTTIESTILPSPTPSVATNSETSPSSIALDLKVNEILPAPTFEEGTPAYEHGALQVSATQITDKNGEVFQLRGISTHGIQWFNQFVNETTFNTLRDDWKVNVIRLALYADTESLYPENQEAYTAIMEKGIDAATHLGLYVIVDWHLLADGDPLLHEKDADNFFNYFATKYQHYPNILFEICNEPNGGKVDWDNSIKPYANHMLTTIRKSSPKSLVIVGTPKWCQSPLSVVRNRIEDPNVLYAFHFYANTHKDPLRETLENAIVKYELPLFVSEFGTCDASGTGDINAEQSTLWLDLLDKYHISWVNWSLCDKEEASALLLPGANPSHWSESELTKSALYIKERLLSYSH